MAFDCLQWQIVADQTSDSAEERLRHLITPLQTVQRRPVGIRDRLTSNALPFGSWLCTATVMSSPRSVVLFLGVMITANVRQDNMHLVPVLDALVEDSQTSCG